MPLSAAMILGVVLVFMGLAVWDRIRGSNTARTPICNSCKGTGEAPTSMPIHWMSCPECQGTGRVKP